MYKGLAILGVVITHLALIQGGTGGTESEPSALVQFMYSGLIMFIVISGFFHKPGRTYMENLKKRVIPLLLVFIASTVILTLVMFAYMCILGYDLSQYSSVWDVIYNVLITKSSFIDWTTEAFAATRVIMAPFEVTIQMYYLQMLVIGYILFYMIADKVLKDTKIAIATIVVMFAITSVYCEFIHIQLPFYIHYAPMVTGFLLTGALVARTDITAIIDKNVRDKRFWIILLVSAVLSAFFLAVLIANAEITRNDFGNYGIFSVFIFAMTSLSCGMFQMMIVALLTKIPGLSHLFADMGKNTLYIFLLHMFIAKLIIAPFIDIGVDKWIPLGTMNAILLSFGTVAVTLVLSHAYGYLKRTAKEKYCGAEKIENS